MTIRVEVVYALPHRQSIVGVELEPGSKVADAIAASRIADLIPGGLAPGARMGVWGVLATADTELRDGDRVEIYRDLLADPKQARRARAVRHRVSRKRD